MCVLHIYICVTYIYVNKTKHYSKSSSKSLLIFAVSYIFCHYYNILIMLSSRSISQNFLWLRETLLSESFPVTCRLRRSTLSYNSSVPALLGGVWGRGLNDCICAALHSSTLAWNIPWTEVPGRLQSLESQRVGCD